MAQPHRPATPSSPENSDATEGLPASVTATRPQSDFHPPAAPPPAAAASVVTPPAAAPPAAVPPAGAPEGPDEGYADHPARPWRRWGRREALVLALCAVLGTGIGVTGQRLTTSSPPPSPSPSASTTPKPLSTAPVQATITPVAPGGTSSFTIKDGVYQSETYTNANFGNLKNGIGLLFDLGTARSLTSITFTATPGPLTVELRAGDSAATDGSKLTLVGRAVDANGAASLPASTGGSHRYWMIWVTQLPPGFKAKIASPVARG